MNLGLGLSIHSRRGGGSGAMGRGPSFEGLLHLGHGIAGLSAVKPPIGVDLDRSHPQLQGCVAWWPMLEGSGTRVRDYIGTNHGTLTNFTAASSWVTGKDGPAPNFDGTNDKILWTSPVVSNLSTGATFTWRMKRTTLVTVDVVFGNSAAASTSIIYCNATTNLILETNTDTDTAAWSNASMADQSQWHHYAIAGSALSLQLYQDGRLITPTDSVVADSALTLNQLGAVSAATSPFIGQIDDVRIYNRALTQTRIQDIMMNPWAPFLGWADQFI